MKRSLLVPAIFCVASLAHAQHRHVHGEGRLDVAIDRDTITLHGQGRQRLTPKAPILNW